MKNYLKNINNINYKNVCIINGPNLNMLGTRERNIYGKKSLEDLEKFLKNKLINNKINLYFYQSNYEGALITKIHNSLKCEFLYFIINLGAYTHSSIGIRDALLTVKIPFFEVHITNIYSRESFRFKSYISDIALGVICGLGFNSYYYALQEIEYRLLI